MLVIEKMDSRPGSDAPIHVGTPDTVRRVPSLHVLETIPLPDGTERDIVCVTLRRLSHGFYDAPVTMEYIAGIAEACGLKSCPMGVLNVLMQRRAISIGDYTPYALHSPDTLLYFVLPRP